MVGFSPRKHIPQEPRKRVRFVIAVTLLQGMAAIFFVIDSLIDARLQLAGDSATMSWFEAGIGIALLAGIVLGTWLIWQMIIEAREREQIISLARGAVADAVATRFSQWSLSGAERDVALFALKGCTIAEIARLRGSAEGTVRAQLSQVYAKAGVSSHATLLASIFEELV